MARIVCNIAPGRMDAPFFHPQEPPVASTKVVYESGHELRTGVS